MDCCSAATIIQKSWKGYKVRKEFEKVYQSYYETAMGIDGSSCFIKNDSNPKNKTVFARPALVASDIFHHGIKPPIAEPQPEVDNDMTYASSVQSEQIGQDINTVSLSDQLASSLDQPLTKEELIGKKRDITMELLWVQQAIESRKNYLKLKQQIA